MMKVKIFFLTWLILIVGISFALPVWAQQAQAHASIIIILPPDYEKPQQEKATKSGYEEIMIVKDTSTITVIPKDKPEQVEPEIIKEECASAFNAALAKAGLRTEKE